MDSTNFNGKAGRFVRHQSIFRGELKEFDCFVPARLPEMEEFCKDVSLVEKSNKANNALGELKGLTKNLGHLNLFIEPYLRKEAVDSSKIEGTFVSLTDVFLSEAGSKKPASANLNVREVVNFVRAIDHSIAEIKNKGRIDKELLNNMHRIILEDTRGDERATGEFRKVQNFIRIGATEDPDFVPPPEGEVEGLMDYLFNYMNETGGFLRLIKAGLIHYYFETIHPYEDGNGRVGRTLILLYLIKSNVLDEPILHLSPYFRRYREVYYNLLMEVRQTGDYVKWVKFFLDGVTETAINTSEKVRKLIELYEDYKKRLLGVRARSVHLKLLDVFFERPYWSISSLQAKLGGENYPKTKRAMKYLIDAKIIREFTKYKRSKIFVAPEILKILEEDMI